VVELFDHLHRQVDVVFGELKQRGRVVHQYVGIEHVGAFGLGCHQGWGRSGLGCIRAARPMVAGKGTSVPARPATLGGNLHYNFG